MKILLICGHGAGDPGACANSYQEANLVREMGPKLKEALAPYADVTLFDVTKNMYKHLKANNPFNFKPYNYVLELHFNAGVNDTSGNRKTTGTEILVHTSEKCTSVEKAILENIAALGFNNRGIKKRSNLLNMNKCKGSQGVSYALIETCFIDDIDDMKLYQKKKDAVVTAITQGIIKGFNLIIKNPRALSTANDIAWELNANYFPITGMDNFVKALEDAKKQNSPLYWGYYKLANKIK